MLSDVDAIIERLRGGLTQPHTLNAAYVPLADAEAAVHEAFEAGRAAAPPDVSHAVCSWTYVAPDRAGEALLRIRKLVKDANGWPTDGDPQLAAASPDQPCSAFAAGRAAATPHSQDCACATCAVLRDCIAAKFSPSAAAPDERLREAAKLLREVQDEVSNDPDYTAGWRSAAAFLERAALAAADRAEPEGNTDD